MDIASEDEILEYLSRVMRREEYDEENIKFSDSFKAAELLGKYYGMFGDKHVSSAGDVIIVDNIPGEKENAQKA